MVLTTETIRIAWKQETAYASGKGATKYGCTAFEAGDVADLTVMNYPMEQLEIGKYVYERGIMKPVGSGANTKKVFNKGVTYGVFKYICYDQGPKWAALSLAATSGTVGDSFVFHIEKIGLSGAIDYFDICGSVILDYKLNVINEDFVKEEITFIYYQIVDSVAVTNLARPNFATAALTFADFSIHISGTTAQTVTGTVDLSGGHDWSGGSAETFTVDGTTVTLDANCANLTAVVAEVQAGLTAAGITYITASESTNYVKLTSTEVYVLADGTGAAATIGLVVGEYGLAEYTECTDFDFMVTNVLLDMKPVGKNQRMDPYLKSRDLEVNLSYYTDVANIYGETITETAVFHDVYITDGTNHVTITQMIVIDENIEEIPKETDFYVMKSKLVGGGATVITFVEP